MIEIRPATGDDVLAPVALADGLNREDAGQRDPCANVDWVRTEGEARLGRIVNAEDAACFVAVVAGEPIGFASGRLEPSNAFCLVAGAQLGSLFVRPGHRGHGVGELLVDAFLKWARANGAERVTVSAFARNEGGLRFYERAGFEPQSVTLQHTLGRRP